jgi:hypothetical protein
MGIISSSVTLAAAVVQALAMVFFTYRIMKACGEPMGVSVVHPTQTHIYITSLYIQMITNYPRHSTRIIPKLKV